MGKIIRNTLILTIITVVAGLGLGLVYEVTKEPIARTEEQAKREAWQTVFSDVSLEDFNADHSWCNKRRYRQRRFHSFHQ